MAGEINVIEGDTIPLQAVDTDRDSTKVVKCKLLDLDTGVQIGPIITLTNAGDGVYRDSSYPMPDVDFILAVYQIFDADGVTPNTTGEKTVTDVFAKAKAVGISEGGSTPVTGSPLEVVLDPTDPFEIELNPGEPLVIQLGLIDPVEVELGQIVPLSVELQQLSALEVELGVCDE